MMSEQFDLVNAVHLSQAHWLTEDLLENGGSRSLGDR